jgi:hypothetical protein
LLLSLRNRKFHKNKKLYHDNNQGLPPLRLPGISELLEIYGEIDGITKRLEDETGLHCPPFCKECCNRETVNIECSVLEVLPLAISLTAGTGRALS